MVLILTTVVFGKLELNNNTIGESLSVVVDTHILRLFRGLIVMRKTVIHIFANQ